ncbi:DNA helicase [Tanacetum coccineum]
MRGKKTNEFTNTGLTQLEKQPPDILTHTQAPGTLEALDNVRIPYASGCNVPSIGAPTGVFVLPFGGVSASEEMLNLLGNLQRERTTTFRVVCRIEDAKLYSDVYQKYRQGCKEVSREGPSTISNGTPSAADVMRVDCESQNLKSTDAADVFQAYSALCLRGIGGRRSVNVCQTTTVSSSNFIYDNGIRNTGPSTSLGGRNARGNSEVSLTTGEATCSRGIGGRPSLNVRQPTTVSSSNFIHDNNLRNIGPSTSRIGRNTRKNPKVDLTTCEATCSRGIHGHPSVNVRQTITVCSSNFIHDNDARNTGTSTLRGGRNTHVNLEVILTTAEAICSSGISRRRSVRRRTLTRGPTVGSSSVAGAGTSYTYTDFGDSGQCCRHCGASFCDLDPDMVDGLIHFLDAYNELVQLFKTTRDKCGELDIPEFKIRLYNGQGVRGYEFPTSNTLGALAFESERMSFAEFLSRRFNLLFFLKEERIFGNVTGVLYTVEFQKRRLPHFALVELPDLRVDLDGYNIVSETMMHGPCGAAYFMLQHEGWTSVAIEPAIQILVVHLQDMQRITFRDRDRLRSVVDLPGKKNTTLTEWFAYNASNEMGRHLSYLKFPSEFVWHSDSKSWPPQRNSKSSIGLACEALGLLGNDREWETALEEACTSATSKQLRFMSQDIPKKVSEKVQIPNYHLNVDSLQGYTLYELEIILNDYGKSLQSFGFPPPPADLLEQLANRLLMEERNYNQEELIQLKNDYVKHSSGKPSLAVFVRKERLYWQSHLQVFTLKQNLNLKGPDSTLEEHSPSQTHLGAFLATDIGDKKIGRPAEEDLENTSWIDIPASYCLTPDEQGLSKLINFIYDQSLDMVLAKVQVKESDEATPTKNDGAETEMIYPIEHLNTLKLPGFPPHHLELKVGAPVMLLWNVNLAGGLYSTNMTLEVKSLPKRIAISPPEMDSHLLSAALCLIERRGLLRPEIANPHGLPGF